MSDFTAPSADPAVLRAVGGKLEGIAAGMAAHLPTVVTLTASMQSHWGEDTARAAAATADTARILGRRLGDQAEVLRVVGQAMKGVADTVQSLQEFALHASLQLQASPDDAPRLRRDYLAWVNQLERAVGTYANQIHTLSGSVGRK